MKVAQWVETYLRLSLETAHTQGPFTWVMSLIWDIFLAQQCSQTYDHSRIQKLYTSSMLYVLYRNPWPKITPSTIPVAPPSKPVFMHNTICDPLLLVFKDYQICAPIILSIISVPPNQNKKLKWWDLVVDNLIGAMSTNNYHWARITPLFCLSTFSLVILKCFLFTFCTVTFLIGN